MGLTLPNKAFKIKIPVAEGKRQKGKFMLTCNVFKKDKTSKEGKKFKSYLTRITNKETKEEVSASVKFEEGCDAPKDFPVRINVINGSVSSKPYQDPATMEKRTSYTLWVREWEKSEEPYVDNSLDEWK